MRYCKLFSQARHILQFGWLLNGTLIFLKNLRKTSIRLLQQLWQWVRLSKKCSLLSFSALCILYLEYVWVCVNGKKCNGNCNVCIYELHFVLELSAENVDVNTIHPLKTPKPFRYWKMDLVLWKMTVNVWKARAHAICS